MTPDYKAIADHNASQPLALVDVRLCFYPGQQQGDQSPAQPAFDESWSAGVWGMVKKPRGGHTQVKLAGASAADPTHAQAAAIENWKAQR